MQRPFNSQSPYRVGSSPEARPPISGTDPAGCSAGASFGTLASAGFGGSVGEVLGSDMVRCDAKGKPSRTDETTGTSGQA